MHKRYCTLSHLVLAEIVLLPRIQLQQLSPMQDISSSNILRHGINYVKRFVKRLLVLRRSHTQNVPLYHIVTPPFRKVVCSKVALMVALRMRPPVPSGLQRVAPDGGAYITGQYIPGKVVIELDRIQSRPP